MTWSFLNRRRHQNSLWFLRFDTFICNREGDIRWYMNEWTCCTFAFTRTTFVPHSGLLFTYPEQKKNRWWPYICCYSTKIMEFFAWSNSCCRHYWTIQKTVEISLVQLIVLFYAYSPGCSLLHVFNCSFYLRFASLGKGAFTHVCVLLWRL